MHGIQQINYTHIVEYYNSRGECVKTCRATKRSTWESFESIVKDLGADRIVLTNLLTGKKEIKKV